jgi:hypothetical protein
VREFSAQIGAQDLSDIHPSARGCVHEWLSEMQLAERDNDAAKVARLVGIISNKIKDEHEWTQDVWRA